MCLHFHAQQVKMINIPLLRLGIDAIYVRLFKFQRDLLRGRKSIKTVDPNVAWVWLYTCNGKEFKTLVYLFLNLFIIKN